jgi:4-hydroxythreonine-4-phosphate dehydrogenase
MASANRERNRPRILLTLGDVAGVGPEVILRAWAQPALHEACRPVVVGHAGQLERQRQRFGPTGEVCVASAAGEIASRPDRIVCLQATARDLGDVGFGAVNAEAGGAACDFLCRAIDLTLAGEADAIVTAPIHKEGLRAAGVSHPGHTEILAARTGAARCGMMLFAFRHAEPGLSFSGRPADGWGVTHVTLHMALRDVFARLSEEAILEKILLTDEMLRRGLGRPPRIGVCGLNPHASDGGLFGREERQIIAPAVRRAQEKGVIAAGPLPSDTLFVRARQGEFDGVVAMYHDQGHIPFKLVAGMRAVNVTLGLPILRTSVAHGTAYDIAGQGVADPTSMIEAIRVAIALARAGDA